MVKKVVFFFCCGLGFLPLLFFVACGNSQHDQENGTIRSDTTLNLHVTSTIGVDFGDSNCVFGVIQAVDFTPDGSVAILDSQKKLVSLFSADGVFMGSCGGEGEAPGEFLNPTDIACMNDGRIAVTDPFSREVEVFSSDLEPIETVTQFSGRAPFTITSAALGFAGEQGGFNRNEATITTSLAYWDLSTDSVHVFLEKEADFSPEYIVQRIMAPETAIAADNENIYYSPPTSETYAVYVYPLDGSEAGLLSFPGYTPVARSEADIQADLEAYENRLQRMASQGRGSRLAGTSYDPPSECYAIASVGVDSIGNIWVQRGWEHNPTFDLFSPGETQPSQTVTLDSSLDLSAYDFIITPHGMAAFERNPDDFPKVLLLAL